MSTLRMWRHFDYVLLITTVLLAGYGVLMIYSANLGSLDPDLQDLWRRQAMFGAVGVGLIFLAAIFPRLARLAETKSDGPTSGGAMRMLAHAATAGVAFGIVFAPEVLTLFYGETFVDSAWAMRILLIALWCIYPNYLMTHLLIAHRRQKYYAKIAATCAGFNIVANAVLIPFFGMEGAAVATVFTEGLLFGLSWRHLRAHIDTLTLQNLTFPLHYGAAFLGLLFVIKAFSVTWAALGGAIVLLAWIGYSIMFFHRREVQ